MELNKQIKNLNYYYLINKQGRAAKLDNGKFRCRYKYDCIENINGNKMETNFRIILVLHVKY